MVINGKRLLHQPEWHMNDARLPNDECLEILGITMAHDGSSGKHIENRARKCRRAAYSLMGAGLTYPGSSTEVKTHLWKTMCPPTLIYGTEALPLNKKNISMLESAQGNSIKACLGIPKRHHHTRLSHASHISPVEDATRSKVASLYNKLFSIDNPGRELKVYFLARFITTGVTTQRTLLDSLVKGGFRAIPSAFAKPTA